MTWHWYWRYYWRNYWGDLERQKRVYGWRSFLPHPHVPNRIPAGDGWYCNRCGTRNARVQKRGQEMRVEWLSRPGRGESRRA